MLIWGLTMRTTAQNRIHLCSSHGNSNLILTQQVQSGNRTKVTACRMRTYFCAACTTRRSLALSHPCSANPNRAAIAGSAG